MLLWLHFLSTLLSYHYDLISPPLVHPDQILDQSHLAQVHIHG